MAATIGLRAARNPLSGRMVSALTLTRGLARFYSATPAPSGSALLPDFSLRDRVIVVSGGGRGLGLVQAQACLEAGARVHVLDRLDPPDEFVQAQERAAHAGTALTYHRVDVRADEARLRDTVAGIADAHGRLDGLVAAAAIQHEAAALEHGSADMDRLLQVNVTGAFLTAQAVAREMVRLRADTSGPGPGGSDTSRWSPGSIVLIASMSGTVTNRGLVCPAYNASKAAVLQLARSLAAEWGAHGIRVNTLSPGYIATAMTDGLFAAQPERRIAWAADNMLNRISRPEEYRGAAVFLLSDASSFMTGSDLRVDGGHCAW